MGSNPASRRKRKQRPPPRTSEWTVRYALGAYLLVFAAGLTIATVLTHGALRLGVGVLLVDGVMLATLIPVSRRRRVRPRDLGLRAARPGQSVGLVLLAVFAVAMVNLVWLQGVLGLKQPDSLGVTLHESTAAAVLTGFAAALCAPVVEEIFFRGFLYRALRNRMNAIRAALIVGVLFGLIHGVSYPLDTLPPRMAFGFIACLLYERTGSLYPGIALHCLIDGAGFEVAITGHNRFVFPVFIAIGSILMLYAAIRQATGGRADSPGFRHRRSAHVQLSGPQP
jgi:membrane protease YdiL (CAAX protease family)